MSDNVIPFNNEEPEHHCETCDLVNEFAMYLKDAESHDEFMEIVIDLVNEAKTLGQKELLIAQVNNNIRILDCLHGLCEDDCDC